LDDGTAVERISEGGGMSETCPHWYYENADFFFVDSRNGTVSPRYGGKLRAQEHHWGTHMAWWGVADISMTADDYHKFDSETVDVHVEYEKGGRVGRVLLASLHADSVSIALATFIPDPWLSTNSFARAGRSVGAFIVWLFS
jgi:hypothetical protein